KIVSENNKNAKNAILNKEEIKQKTAQTDPKTNDLKQQDHSSFVANSKEGKDNSTVIYEAKYRKQTPPIYPSRAVELGQQGKVILHIKINEKGLTEQFKVAESSGYELLDMAALAAVKKWEFEPTNINGNLIPSWVRVP